MEPIFGLQRFVSMRSTPSVWAGMGRAVGADGLA